MKPPTRDGVGPSCVALQSGAWKTMLDFLVQRFPTVTREQWQDRMARGQVVDEAGHSVAPDTLCRAQGMLYYYRSLPPEPRIPFDEVLLHQDDYLIAIDKPHFLPVIPSGRYLQETLLVRLKRKLGIDTLVPMHRIDRETAGLVLFTIQPDTRDCYQALFRDRVVKKTYEAIAPWHAHLHFPLDYRSRLEDAVSFMQMREVAGEPNADTAIDIIEVRGQRARYRLQPRTGQRHQLRVQMAALGIPIENDQIYPQLMPVPEQNGVPDYNKPLMLLAKSLEFVDPITGKLRQFESMRSLQF